MKQMHANKDMVIKMCMIRWMSGARLKERIMNVCIKGYLKARQNNKKLRGCHIRWFGNIHRIPKIAPI